MPDLPPVPDCEGPQLHPYPSNGTPEITFLEKIGQGAHGHVFKVKIDDNLFALKVFNCQVLDPEWITANSKEWPKIYVKLLTAQWHPFHAECRAYGRLKETQREDLAVRCYGYLCLSQGQQKELEDRFGIDSWWDGDYDLDDIEPDWVQTFQQEGSRALRAIVKELIPSGVPFNPEHAPMMISDLKQLHRVGIIVHDLKEDAYVAGKLVDFSKAVVVPHILFDHRLRGDRNIKARSEVYEDLARLYGHFDEWNEEHEDGPKITYNPWEVEVAVSRLRRGPLTWQEVMARCFNPRRIQWKKFSSRPEGSVATKGATVRESRLRREPTIGISKRNAGVKDRKMLN